MFDKKTFAKIIKYYRRRYGWSMDYAARQCGFSSAVWHSLEYGKVESPTIKTLLRIANTFGLSLDNLIGRQIREQKPEKAEALPSFFLNQDFHKL